MWKAENEKERIGSGGRNGSLTLQECRHEVHQRVQEKNLPEDKEQEENQQIRNRHNDECPEHPCVFADKESQRKGEENGNYDSEKERKKR